MSTEEKHYSFEESKAFVETFSIEPGSSGALSGLRFAVKDLIDIRGHKTGWGNPDWRRTHPVAAANAVCVDQLLYAGAQCVGKTVTDELAFDLIGENFFYGAPLNPRAPDRVPGGSSSGSASAVACGLVDFAIGTDTGGSVRVPASNCGIFGLRPSHGAVSVAGVNPLAPTFDTVGVFARNSRVLEQATSVLIGCQPADTVPVEHIYLVEEAFDISDSEVREALDRPVKLFKTMFPGQVKGISIREIDREQSDIVFEGWHRTFRAVQWPEIWSCLGSWIEDVGPEFGPRTKTSFELVKSLDRARIGTAVRQREIYADRLKDFLGPHDLLCIPTTPAPAPIKGSIGTDRTKGDYYSRTLSLTCVSGVGRLPQVTLPLADAGGVPIGLSLLAARGMDAFVLAVARMAAREYGIG